MSPAEWPAMEAGAAEHSVDQRFTARRVADDLLAEPHRDAAVAFGCAGDPQGIVEARGTEIVEVQVHHHEEDTRIGRQRMLRIA